MIKKEGFTLAEVLVAVSIVAVVGAIMVAIFTATLRGSNKSQILAVIKQNGQVVLDDFGKTIRSADYLVCPIPGSPNTLMIVKNGTYTRYRIALSADAISTAPASCIGTGTNGCVIFDNPTKAVVGGVEETEDAFIGRVCLSSDSMTSAQILTDTDPRTGVSIIPAKDGLGVPLPFFTKSHIDGYKDSVTIQFALNPGVQAPSVLSGQIDAVTFQTTLGLR